jgi:hypothetical protein
MTPVNRSESNDPEVVDAVEQAQRVFAYGEAVARWDDATSRAELEAVKNIYLCATRWARLAIEAEDGLGSRAIPQCVVLDDGGVSTGLDGLDGHSSLDVRVQLLRLRHEAIGLIRTARVRQLTRSQLLRRRAAIRWSCIALFATLSIALGVCHDLIGDFFELGEVARGRSWVASSALRPYPQRGQMDGSEQPFFFHTSTEAAPSIEIDLAHDVLLRRAIIGNRPDCCGDRAIPLVIEGSRDRRVWKELAVRKRPFNTWRVDFTPERVRWVRLRVRRESILHLRSIVLRT